MSIYAQPASGLVTPAAGALAPRGGESSRERDPALIYGNYIFNSLA